MSGIAVERLVGHLTWSTMFHREGLSIFSSVYRFMSHAKGTPTVLWDSVRQGLRWAIALLPLLEADTSIQWHPVINSFDASNSGYGVCSLDSTAKVAGEIGRRCEKWRVWVEDKVRARTSALLAEPDLLSFDTATGRPLVADAGLVPERRREYAPPFDEVSTELPKSSWTVVKPGGWSYQEDISRTEARACNVRKKYSLLHGRFEA